MAHTKEELEAAENSAGGLVNSSNTINPTFERQEHIEGFLAGIDYQKSQSYSKEDLRKVFEAGEKLESFGTDIKFMNWFTETYPDQKQPPTDQPKEVIENLERIHAPELMEEMRRVMPYFKPDNLVESQDELWNEAMIHVNNSMDAPTKTIIEELKKQFTIKRR